MHIRKSILGAVLGATWVRPQCLRAFGNGGAGAPVGVEPCRNSPASNEQFNSGLRYLISATKRELHAGDLVAA